MPQEQGGLLLLHQQSIIILLPIQEQIGYLVLDRTVRNVFYSQECRNWDLTHSTHLPMHFQDYHYQHVRVQFLNDTPGLNRIEEIGYSFNGVFEQGNTYIDRIVIKVYTYCKLNSSGVPDSPEFGTVTINDPLGLNPNNPWPCGCARLLNNPIGLTCIQNNIAVSVQAFRKGSPGAGVPGFYWLYQRQSQNRTSRLNKTLLLFI